MYESFQSREKRQRINSTGFLHTFRLRQSSELAQCDMKCVIFSLIISDIPYLSAVAGPLKLAERKMTCLSLDKYVLLYRFLKKNYSCRSAPRPWLAKTKLSFLQKHTYDSEKNPHSTSFDVPGQYTVESGKNVLGPLKCLKFHCIRPMPMAGHAASRQNAYGRGCL